MLALSALLFPGRTATITRSALTEDHEQNQWFHCRWEAKITHEQDLIVGAIDTGGDWRDYMTSGDAGPIEISVVRRAPRLQIKVRISSDGALSIEVTSGAGSPGELSSLTEKIADALGAQLGGPHD